MNNFYRKLIKFRKDDKFCKNLKDFDYKFEKLVKFYHRKHIFKKFVF